MKNLFKVFVAMRSIAIIALVAVIGFSFAACGGDDGGGGGGDSLADQLNGTWTSSDGEEITLNKDGSFVISENNKQGMKGTYTAAARSISATITMSIKELHGNFLTENNDDGMTFENKWYNKNQVIDFLKNFMKTAGMTDAQITAFITENSADFDAMFPTITGTVDDNSMTLGDTTYTKNGGENNNNGSRPIIITSAMPNGTVGTAYNRTLTARGDTPITWSIASGTLPAGLTLSAAGVISGTPTTAATSSFTVKATNAKGNDTATLTITIAAGSSVTINGWTIVADSTFTGRINAIAYGGGKFVAGGWDGKMAYSSDGVTWTAVADSTFGTSNISAIAYGGGKFVAVGGACKIAYSSDGVNWTAVVDNPLGQGSLTSLSSIAYGGGKFITGGYSFKSAYSLDGVNWTSIDRSGLFAIAYGNEKFVADGSNSSDGITWSSVASPFGSSSDVSIIAFGNGKFIAVDSATREKMSSSTDGVNWTAAVDMPFTNVTDWGTCNITTIDYCNNKFIAGSFDAQMAYSPDGVTWTVVGTFDRMGTIDTVAYGNGTYVAGGLYGRIMYSTEN